MTQPVLTVAAPRREKWDDADPSSRIVLMQRSRLHPANPDHGMPAGEICICEGEGVAGDPGKVHKPWLVGPTPEINGLLRDGRLVEVKAGMDTADLAMPDDDLAQLDCMNKRIRHGLERKGILDIPMLASALAGKDVPEDWLKTVEGIGPAVASDILAELRARGDI